MAARFCPTGYIQRRVERKLRVGCGEEMQGISISSRLPTINCGTSVPRPCGKLSLKEPVHLN